MNPTTYRALFESAPIGILFCEEPEYVALKANRSALTLLGYSETGLSGIALQAITHKDDWEQECLLIGDVTHGKVSSARLEKRFIRADGAVLFADVNISTIDTDGRILLLFMFQELPGKTAFDSRKHHGQQSGEPLGSVDNREGLLALGMGGQGYIGGTMPIGLQKHWDMAMQQIQGIARLGLWKVNMNKKTIEWSEETYRIFELPIGKKIFKADFERLVHPDDRKKTDRLWHDALQGKSAYDAEFRIKTGDKIKWIREKCEFKSDEGSNVLLAVGFVQDITEEKVAKERLEAKNRELQEIMDALDESSLVSIADRTGQILKVNKRFCQVAKYKEEELVGQPHRIVNSGYHSRSFWVDLWKTIQKGEVWRGEIRNRAKDGSEYWVNTTINPIRNEIGEVVYYLSIRQDITSRKIYEELLLQSNLRLAQIEQFIDFTSDAIQVSDLTGRFVYINEVASQRLGISRHDCQKYKVGDVELLFANGCDWQKHVKHLKAAGTLELEGITRNCSTGTMFPVELRMRYTSIRDREYIVIVSRDITERKKNEAVLRESQTRLAEAQRMAKLGYWELDLTTNKLWWSDEQYAINGIAKTEKEITQQDFINLLHPLDRQRILESMDISLSDRGDGSASYRIIRPDGQVRFLLGYTNVIYNEAGTPVKLSGVNQDITERKMAEKALQESEQTLRKAQAVARIGSWKLDVKDGHLEWSDEVFRIFEIPKKGTLTESDFQSFIHPEDKEFVARSWAAALKGETYDIVHRIIVKGKVKWVREQAELTFDEFKNIIYGFGTVQDITDQKILQDSNLIFNQSLLLTGLGSWRASLTNNDLFLSDNVYNLHGRKKGRTRVTFDNFLSFIHPADRQRIGFVLARALSRKGSFQTEYRVELAPGDTHWLFANGKVLTDREGKPTEMYGIVRDITAEKNNTAELIKARKEAEEASSIKDEFLSVMSHEIRTPLNSVIGLSNLILRRNPREDQLEIMKTLKGAADNLLHLINDILDFNKIRAGKLQLEFIPFSLTKFLQQLHASFRLSAQDKNIDLSMHADAQIPGMLVGDVTRLNQIFNNLLGNAIKFTQKGFVKFTVDVKALTEKHCAVIFRVEDTGVGIPREKLETIFLPFQQSERDTSRKYGGTGLGLSIVKSLVKILQGEITVESSPGIGSAFVVELAFMIWGGAVKISGMDAVMQSLPAAGELPPSSDVTMEKRLCVLYVEDVESNRFLLENLLADHNITTTTASSGKAALQLTGKKAFDLIIMDIQMPGMDGYEATRRIRTQAKGKNKKTPILAFTAEPFSEELRKKVATHGIQDLLTKPFDEAMLMDKINVWRRAQSSSVEICSFLFYENAFAHDRLKLAKIRKSVVRDLERFATKMKLYDAKKNWTGMCSEAHRIRPIINNLKGGSLLPLLDHFRSDQRYTRESRKICRIAVDLAKRMVNQLADRRQRRNATGKT